MKNSVNKSVGYKQKKTKVNSSKSKGQNAQMKKSIFQKVKAKINKPVKDKQ